MQTETLQTRAELSEILRKKGFRLTPQREKILDIFYELPEGEHLSAEELQKLLIQANSDIMQFAENLAKERGFDIVDVQLKVFAMCKKHPTEEDGISKGH